MKTACLARAATHEAAKGGSSARKPFFAAVQRRSDDPIQARLRVGRPGDRFEVEADRTADRVVNGDGAGVLASGVSRIVQRAPADNEEPEVQAKDGEEEREVQTKAAGEDEELAQPRAQEDEPQARVAEEEPEVQRAAAVEPENEEEVQREAAPEEEEAQAKAGSEDEEAQAKSSPEGEQAHGMGSLEEEAQAKAAPEQEEARAKGAEDEEVQTRAVDAAARPASEDLSRQIRASRGLGNPLPGDVREKMSAAFGADVSGVRVHTDAAAVLLARSLKAQAFTIGRDIFFGEGKFSPGSREGQHLLAHELTHTVQQGAIEPDIDAATIVRLAPQAEEAEESYGVRPEIVEAIRLARGEIGKVNAKKTGADGKRLGWERLREYFATAFGGPVVSEAVIDKIVMVERTAKDGTSTRMDALPSWCGIFTWWAMKKSGIPIPDWKLGAPALDAMKPRPPGSLPRKGDIAIDVDPNNHFAMVTGIESATDAEGKPTKMIRVATVNGNTAGDDNLGGQVQERWDIVSRWDHFLDPVGKMSLPEAPLVTVSREPSKEAADVGEAAEAKKEEPSAAAEAAEATDAALEELDADVPPPASDFFGEAPPEPDMSLPPPVEQGPAEVVATVEKVELAGTSDEATTAFIGASPSAMAATQPEFGPAVDAKMKGEQQEIVENPPELAAKTSGSVDVPLKSASEIPIPSDTSLEGGEAALGQGDLDKVSGPAPAPFPGNKERDKQLDEEDESSGGFLDRFLKFIRRFIEGVRTKDPDVDTSAGERPSVDLTKEGSNPAEMGSQREKDTASLRTKRDEHVESFKTNPGQSNIQPRKVDETFQAPVKAEPTATIEGQDDEAVRDFAEAPYPAEVRTKADAKLSEQMAPQLEEARVQTVDAAATRDTEKKAEIDTAQKEAAKINTDADADQRHIVIENRGKVAALQKEGIETAYSHVNEFSKEATKKQGEDRKEISEHVKKEQGAAKDVLDKGEEEARKKKEEEEKKAAEEKEKLKKEEENDGWFGWVKSKIKSAVRFITDKIDKIFNALRKWVKEKIEEVKNAAINLINKARNWVVDKINKFRNWAKDKVNEYLGDTFPGLAKRINDGIDAVADTAIDGVNKAADAAIEGINKLANKLAAALDKILSTFQTALKTAVRVVGAVMQGDFAGALRAAIEGVCEILGIDPKQVFDFLDRAGKAIRSILKDPVGFIRNLFGAVGDGIRAFFKNIKKHLIDGVIGWLTGALGEVNVTGPFEFSPKGILTIVLQILGVTYAKIKARVIRKVPAAEPVFEQVEKGFALVSRINDEGPGALWEELKEKVSDIKATVMAAIRNWLIVTVVKEGITTLLMMTNPASAIVKAVQLLYRLITFLIERYEQIKAFILSVYDAVSAVASGNFTKVVTAVEDALAKVLPVLISLLAHLLGLGSIAKQVKKVIEAITKPIYKAIDWVVDKIAAFAKKVVSKVKAGAKKVKEKAKAAVEKVKEFLWPKKKFTVDGESHTVYFEEKGGEALPYIRSTPTALESFIAEWEANAVKPVPSAKVKPLANAKAKVAEIRKLARSIGALEKKKKPVPAAKKQEMLTLQTELCSILRELLGTKDAIAKGEERYKLEGLTGTFATVPKPTGDYLTGDHQPQAASIQFLAGRPYFKAPFGADIRKRAEGDHAVHGYVINLQDARHKAGRTWGTKGSTTKAEFATKVLDMEKSESKDDKRRSAAVGLLKKELAADVSSMVKVYKRPQTDDVWKDLDEFASDKKSKGKLVGKIREQVNKGESYLAAQPMSLAS